MQADGTSYEFFKDGKGVFDIRTLVDLTWSLSEDGKRLRLTRLCAGCGTEMGDLEELTASTLKLSRPDRGDLALTREGR